MTRLNTQSLVELHTFNQTELHGDGVKTVLDIAPATTDYFIFSHSVMAVVILALTSTADTRTEKRAPVFSFRSLMSLNSQVMAQGIMPRP